MNKERTIAATRIKNKIAKAAKNEAKARSLVKVSEAKAKKISEAFDAAKKVVDQHKQTLELAKKQIIESRELNKRYEQLLNLKYNQLNSLTEAHKKLADDKKEVDDIIDKCKKVIKLKHKQTEALTETVKSLKQKASIISENKDIKEMNDRKIERYKNRIKFLEAKIEKLKEEFKDVRVKAKVVPFDDQAVKPKKVSESTNKFNSSQIDKLAKIYSTRYRVPEAASRKILDKYNKNEAIMKLESIVKEINKYVVKKNEAKSIVKTNETKSKVNESASTEIDGTTLYSHFI